MADARALSDRRHQAARAKARAARFLGVLFRDNPGAITPKRIGRYATDRTPCSCAMCGNPRRHSGEPTRREMAHHEGADG